MIHVQIGHRLVRVPPTRTRTRATYKQHVRRGCTDARYPDMKTAIRAVATTPQRTAASSRIFIAHARRARAAEGERLYRREFMMCTAERDSLTRVL